MRQLGVAALLFSTAAAASEGTVFYARIGEHLGFGRYDYTLGGQQAGRHATGFLLSTSIDVGVKLGNNFVLGGSASFDPIWGLSGSSPRGTARSAVVSPGGGFGVMAGYKLDKFLFGLAVLAGGGGAGAVAGGFGVYFAPYAGFAIVKHNDRLHLFVDVRPLFGVLHDFQGQSDLLFGGLSAGVSVAWL